jgi:DNA-binding MarR family transcriptional regulator/GNAT superfamily N-acetyltransferase
MDGAIAAVRGFNRFYTQFVGALDPRFLGSETTLAEARVLFEIAQAGTLVAADLQASLGMDAGYVSRLIARFEARGWVERGRGGTDARRRPIGLTPAGRAVFETIETRQRARMEAALGRLGALQRADLVAALGMARALLDPGPAQAMTLRTLRTGDAAMIAARQSLIYAQEYGWGRGLEINEAETASAFLRNFKPGREQGWVAELGGTMAGSVLLTDEGDGVARLRLLYVEAFARGQGIGGRLVEACIGFARETGYSAMTLWTHTVLASARRIYAAQGFRMVAAATHETFGVPVQGETWRLDLRS